jgi:hypothetical protein
VQVADMPDVQQVEAAIGERDVLARLPPALNLPP